MEDFKSITINSPVIKIANCVRKIYDKIVESREKSIPQQNVKEIEFLRNQCKSENIHLCLMSCQTFVKLVENGSVELSFALTMFVTLLPNSSFSQYAVITENIVSLLLLSLKRQVSQLKEGQKFACPYGIKSSQHPIITLIQNDGSNMIDVASKINGICNHHDKEISTHSIEFLRPVFLYILCNPQTLPDSKTIWTGLLAQSKISSDAYNLIREILSWSKISSPNTCLFTSMILIETIEHYRTENAHKKVAELSIYLMVIVNHLIQFGIDPRPSLHCVYRNLQTTSKASIKSIYNVILVIISQTVHIISPVYLTEVFQIIEHIIITENCGNQYILYMILDGAIEWMSQIAFIPTDGRQIAKNVIRKITQNIDDIERISTQQAFELGTLETDQSLEIKNFHPDVALAFDLAKLAESFDESEYKNIFTFVDSLNVKTRTVFCQQIVYFLRALFLSKEPSLDCWFKICQTILSLIKDDENVALDFQMTYVYKLATETHPEMQLELLRGLPTFAISKDNVPMILNITRALSTGPNQTLAMELYLRLWKVEPRTYRFLLDSIAQKPRDGVKENEHQVAKAYTIKEICQEKPTQHGPDLVTHLSDILNESSDDDGAVATSLSLDAIISLCESNTVNIVSTWKALSGKFRHEKRIQVLKSLYRFFSNAPLLYAPTPEFEELLNESLDHLWLVIAQSENPVQVREALMALKNFEPGTTMLFKHIHPRFSEGLTSVNFEGAIPGECWIQLLQKIKPNCIKSAADLIASYISKEVSGYRGGVYFIPEGRGEPRRITGLFANSVTRALIDYLINQARLGDHNMESLVVTNVLRALSRKFPKPIPPVDWSFLHPFFHISFEARKYCIFITKNQARYSGTSKRILENFLAEFEPNCFEEDLLLLFDILPEISSVVSLNILKAFMEKISVYCFKESQLAGFLEGCLFENFLDSIKSVFLSETPIPEVLDMLTLIVERYLDSMDMDSRLFEKYTEVVGSLSQQAIDGLTSPSNWWEVPIGKLKKATIIRCYLVLYNNKLENPLVWLDPLVDAFFDKSPEDREFFFRHLCTTLFAYDGDETSCGWIMDLFVKIQALLADATEQNLKKINFLLDIFIMSIVVLSGCAVLLGNLNVVATTASSRNDIFPESLQMISRHAFWKDNEAKIYEFLHQLYKNSSIPDNIRELFKFSIICSRNKTYFDAKGVWTKYLGLRK